MKRALRAELRGEGLALGLAPAGEDDLGAFLDEQLGRARADAAGGAGDDGDLAVDHAHCCFLLSLVVSLGVAYNALFAYHSG